MTVFWSRRSATPAFLISAALLLCAASGVAQSQGAPAGSPPSYTQPMVLSDAQVQGFLGAMKDLQALEGRSSWTMSGKAGRVVQGMQFNAEARSILEKHGFADEEQFRRVAYNTAMAHGVIEQGGKEKLKKDLDQSARQQAAAMESLKGHMSPEQLKALQGHAAASMAMVGTMTDVPEENLALVKKYGPEIDALSAK